MTHAPTSQRSAEEVVAFWRDAGPDRWWSKSEDFDARFRREFQATHEQAAAGRLEGWLATPVGALALVLLLDQFPRNCFRGEARTYATDDLALRYAKLAVDAGLDRAIEPDLRLFLYMPFMHSEDMSDQDRSVELNQALGDTDYAVHHRSIVARFGRFPHRNAVLGRTSTPDEEAFLAAGGFAG